MRTRPKGVLFLGVLSLLAGAIIIIIGVSSIIASAVLEDDFYPAYSELSRSEYYITGVLILIGFLLITSGVGMLKGTVWGWWIAVFSFAFAVLRAANSIYYIPTIAAQINAPPDYISGEYIKFSSRVITNSLIIWYFFSNRVMSYFQVKETAKLKKLGIIGMVTAVVGIILAIVATAFDMGF